MPLVEPILKTLFGGRASVSYSATNVEGTYKPGFKARLALKGLRLATAAIGAAGKELPMLAAARGRMANAVEAGHGDKDWSVIAELSMDR